MLNKKVISVIIVMLLLIIYFSIDFALNNKNLSSLKSLLSNEQKIFLRNKIEYIFPYKTISKNKREISELKEKIVKLKQKTRSYNDLNVRHEFYFKKSLSDIPIEKIENIKLSNNKMMHKYRFKYGFFNGINYRAKSGSGYIDYHQNSLFVLSPLGILGYNKNIVDTIYFQQIENNIDDFIGLNISLRDLFIHQDKIFISFTEEIKKNCYNTSVIYGNINYESIIFNKLFSSKECANLHEIDGFTANQSGGRILNFDDNHILLSVGEYRARYLAQDKKSINGKIIKINIHSGSHSIISMGHRNPQGLYFDKEKNFLLETEHGPLGGDEINLIEVDKINENDPLNYGWPIASAGEHYCSSKGKDKCPKEIYEKYPLYKSHIKYNFIEPLKSFVPSIAPSEITKIGKNSYVLGSMKDKSLYFFELTNEKNIINLKRVEVFERIRDLKFKNNQLYLFLEDTSSIGVISLL